jgi:histidine triad (HIT) family protein
MNDCPLCNFSDKSVVIYEDELCLAALDKKPINTYHCIVFPRVHYKNFVDLPDELSSHLFLVVKKISRAIRQAAHPEAIHHISDDDISDNGYNLVSHYKFHIIPRYANDGVQINWKRQNLPINERQKISAEIKKLLQ